MRRIIVLFVYPGGTGLLESRLVAGEKEPLKREAFEYHMHLNIHDKRGGVDHN